MLHRGTDFVFGQSRADCLVHLVPDDELGDVTGQEADDEEDHYDYNEEQGLFDFGLLCELSPSQMYQDFHSAVENDQ